MKQLEFDLPKGEEPDPYLVRVWRHQFETDYPFVTREEAIAYAISMEDLDCFVEGIFYAGVFDDGANREAFPWRY